MSPIVRLAALLAALPLAGCGLLSEASITKMVPGGNPGSGDLDCWLTLEFDRYPSGDPRDVEVRFESVALEEPASFDWDYIAARDVTPNGGGFGSGHRSNDDTTAETDPPLGQPLKVLFPLRQREHLEARPSELRLEATLYWGGKRQDSMKRPLGHVYQAEGSLL